MLINETVDILDAQSRKGIDKLFSDTCFIEKLYMACILLIKNCSCQKKGEAITFDLGFNFIEENNLTDTFK
jgi:hypothetical protein